MVKRRHWNRRAFLGGAGVALGLPLLGSLLPRRARAQEAASPARFIAIYTPNGMNMADWTPTTTGPGYALTPILQPLTDVREHVLVLSGIDNRPAETDDFGQHAPATAAFLTCNNVTKSQNINNAISADQVAARAFGGATRFASLQLGTDGGSNAGGCDGGYSCAYTRNISWASATSPMPKMVSPRAVFDLLFAGTDPTATAEERARRRLYDRSVIDSVLADATALESRLGGSDRQKLDEYLTGVRELEVRLDDPDATCEPIDRPGAGPDFPARVKLMLDLMVVAIQCDLTRVITFMMGNSISNHAFPFIGVPDGHHATSHHRRDPAKLAKLTKIDRWEVQQFTYLVTKLAAMDDIDGKKVIENSLVYFASEVADGNTHTNRDLPILLAGHAGDVRPGRHVRYAGAPLANLYISILRQLGVSIDTFGDDGTGNIGRLT